MHLVHSRCSIIFPGMNDWMQPGILIYLWKREPLTVSVCGDLCNLILHVHLLFIHNHLAFSWITHPMCFLNQTRSEVFMTSFELVQSLLVSTLLILCARSFCVVAKLCVLWVFNSTLNLHLLISYHCLPKFPSVAKCPVV